MTDSTWHGKQPRSDLAPLTIEWFRCAMQPRYQSDGATLLTLTPPTNNDEWSPIWAVVGIGCVVLLGAVFTFPLWR